MELKEASEVVVKPGVFIGIVPCLNSLLVDAAWSLIRKDSEDLANASMGEYTIYQVWQAIFYGQAHLHLGFVDKTGKTKQEEGQSFVMDRIIRKEKEGYAGYFLLRMDPTGLFVWQAAITPEFQNSNVLDLGLEYIKARARDIGAGQIIFTTVRGGWGKRLKESGFQETFTTYRTDVKK